MDAEAFCGSKYLTGNQVEEPETVTIAGVHPVTEYEEDRLAVLFVDPIKPLLLNKTNTETLCKLFGKETDNWTDKEITLTQFKTKFGGKKVMSIRVSKPEKTPAGGTTPPHKQHTIISDTLCRQAIPQFDNLQEAKNNTRTPDSQCYDKDLFI